MTAPVRLDAVSVEAIAQRVVALLAEQDRPTPAGLVDAATLARALGVSRATVYEHADRLGARRLTDGTDGRRPRLRFDLEEALAAWRTRRPRGSAQLAQPTKPRRRGRGKRSTAGLLPIRGEGAA